MVESIAASNKASYPTGFHIFTTKEDAEDWLGPCNVGRPDFGRVVGVRYRNVVASGFQAEVPIHVARKMYVSEKEWRNSV